jgi:hypothetical protein
VATFLPGRTPPFPSQKTPVFFIGDITNELWKLSLSFAFNLILFYKRLKPLVFLLLLNATHTRERQEAKDRIQMSLKWTRVTSRS